jgi:phosphomevalonate kinase
MKSHDLHIGASGTSSSTGGTYQKYVNWHNNDAEHLTVSFLPWHRVMLWELEEDLIKADEQLVFNCVS